MSCTEPRHRRRGRTAWVAAPLALLAALSAPLRAQQPPGPEPAAAGIVGSEDEIAVLRQLTEKHPRDAAIAKAIEYLASKQRTDGSITEDGKFRTAMTSLAVMAFLAAGHTPQDDQYGSTIRQAVTFVLSQASPNGYFGEKDGSRMYGHGITALMLTEVLGMLDDEALSRRVREATDRALRLIVQAQAVPKNPNDAGGWRYNPDSRDSDLSLTGWITMALRSGKEAGLNIPPQVIERAVAYIRGKADPSGGFGYQENRAKETLSGVGLLTLAVCGVYEAKELERTTTKILRDKAEWRGPWFFYHTYYDSAGMYQMGDAAWKRYYPMADAVLVKNQSPDGSWPRPPNNDENADAIYRTSLAVLALSIHHHFLPIYQR